MDAGRLDKRAVVMRRPVITDDEGEDSGQRGDYAPAMTLWANYKPLSAREAAEGGRAQNVETGTLTIRDSVQARTITNGERIVLQGRDFGVTGAGLPDRRTGMIQLNISTDLGGQ